MPVSQNGWTANNVNLTSSQLVPGTQVKLRVRNDAPGLLLLEVAAAFDRLVEDIDNARGALDDWGYAERPIRGGSTLSNHASGTAIDLNAPKHPLGVPASKNFTPNQIAQIRKIVSLTGGVVRWGGDYSGRPDPMHFEINDNKSMGDCQKALERIRAFNRDNGVATNPAVIATGVQGVEVETSMVPVLREGDGRKGGGERGRLHWYVLSAQALLNVRGVGQVPETGVFDSATSNAVKALQQRSKIAVDGVIGPQTWRFLLGNDAPDFA